jgi:hypothetical protein
VRSEVQLGFNGPSDELLFTVTEPVGFERWGVALFQARQSQPLANALDGAGAG